MRKVFRARNVFLLLVSLPLVLYIAYAVAFDYRTNSCAPGDRVLQSEADAIEVAKRKFIQNPRVRFHMGDFGSASAFVDALSETRDCCSAVRSVYFPFLVVWDVQLYERTAARPNGRSAQLFLSNCGTIFTYDSYALAE